MGSAKRRRINAAVAVSLLVETDPPFHALNFGSAKKDFVLISVSNRVWRHWFIHSRAAVSETASGFRSLIESEEVATPPPSSNKPFCSS